MAPSLLALAVCQRRFRRALILQQYLLVNIVQVRLHHSRHPLGLQPRNQPERLWQVIKKCISERHALQNRRHSAQRTVGRMPVDIEGSTRLQNANLVPSSRWHVEDVSWSDDALQRIRLRVFGILVIIRILSIDRRPMPVHLITARPALSGNDDETLAPGQLEKEIMRAAGIEVERR